MFTDNEFELLMDALDALNAKWSSDVLFSGIVRSMMSTKENPEQLAKEVEQEYYEAEQLNKSLKNRIVLLKAKLINMQDSTAIQEAKKFMEG